MFTNEDLAKFRRGLLFEARKLFKSAQIRSAWSSEGNILIKDKYSRVHRIISNRRHDVYVPLWQHSKFLGRSCLRSFK